jgi:hypothetical protein
MSQPPSDRQGGCDIGIIYIGRCTDSLCHNPPRTEGGVVTMGEFA